MINGHAMTSVVAGIIILVVSPVLFSPMAKGRGYTFYKEQAEDARPLSTLRVLQPNLPTHQTALLASPKARLILTTTSLRKYSREPHPYAKLRTGLRKTGGVDGHDQ